MENKVWISESYPGAFIVACFYRRKKRERAKKTEREWKSGEVAVRWMSRKVWKKLGSRILSIHIIVVWSLSPVWTESARGRAIKSEHTSTRWSGDRKLLLSGDSRLWTSGFRTQPSDTLEHFSFTPYPFAARQSSCQKYSRLSATCHSSTEFCINEAQLFFQSVFFLRSYQFSLSTKKHKFPVTSKANFSQIVKFLSSSNAAIQSIRVNFLVKLQSS